MNYAFALGIFTIKLGIKRPAAPSSLLLCKSILMSDLTSIAEYLSACYDTDDGLSDGQGAVGVSQVKARACSGSPYRINKNGQHQRCRSRQKSLAEIIPLLPLPRDTRKRFVR